MQRKVQRDLCIGNIYIILYSTENIEITIYNNSEQQKTKRQSAH